MTTSHSSSRTTIGSRPTGRRLSNRLVAIGSASVLTVYTAGYLKTKAASERLADAESQRRSAAPISIQAPAPTMSLPPLAEVAPPAGTVARGENPPVTAFPTGSERLAVRPASIETGADAARPATTGHSAIAGAPAASKPERNDAVACAAAPAEARSPSAALAAAATPDSNAAQPAAAPVSIADASTSAAAPAAPKTPQYKDGTYTGWGTSRHGDIQATVVVTAGRIVSATISECWTRWPCTWVGPLPPQVVQRQSAEVDYVTGATQSTNAFYYAVVDALGKAK